MALIGSPSSRRLQLSLFGVLLLSTCATVAAESNNVAPPQQHKQQRSLVQEFFDLVTEAQTEDDPPATGTTTYPDLTAQAAKEECPAHDPSQDIMFCGDPSKQYEIPCNADTCRWDLAALNSQAPPGFCALVALDQTVLSSGKGIPDTLKPCVLWELSFGGMTLPTVAPALGEYYYLLILLNLLFVMLLL